MSVKALIFDVDGTLADTEELHRRAFNDAFAKFGLSWNWGRSVYADLLEVAGGRERLAHFIDLIDVSKRERARLRQLVSPIHAYKTLMYSQRLMTGAVTLRPGVERLLIEARAAGIGLAIATTTSRSNVHELLVCTLGEDAQGWFAAIVAGEDVARKKPAPDVYRVALDKLQLPAAYCVAFEDSFIGLQAAKAVGLFTVVTPTCWTQRDNLSAADWLLPNLCDLCRLDELHSRHAKGALKALEAA